MADSLVPDIFPATGQPPDADVAAPRVSVVICCYTPQRWPQVTAAVASLQDQTTPPHEVVLVVDHCPELTQRARRQLGGVIVVDSLGPPGLSGARNTGIAVAEGDVIAFLDDDATAEGDWIERLSAPYVDPRVIAVGGHVEPRWDPQRPTWFPTEFDWVVGCSHSGLPSRTAVVRNLVGANMSFRRQALRDLGGFRTDLGRRRGRPLGCEETELCIRSTVLGGQVIYEPAARVSHYVPRDRQTHSYFRARCYAEGLSKAMVVRITGRGSGLAEERAYVRRTLPAGVVRGLRVAATTRDVTGLHRATAIVTGLAATCIGYGVGFLDQARRTGLVRTAARSASLRVLIPLLVAVGLWLASLPSVRLDRMTDIGLVSVLPPTYWIALALVLVSTAVLLHRPRAPEWAVPSFIALLIGMLHGTPTLLYGSLRYAWAWKHVGIVDYIIRHGTVDPQIGNLAAYHAWPGFFSLNAFLTQASGWTSALSYAAWAPPVMQLLYLPLLLMIFRTVTSDSRRIGLGLVLFYLGDWIGQEYFSPQAFGYLEYLAVVAICLRWLPATGRGIGMRLRRWSGGSPPSPVQRVTTRQRVGLLAVVIAAMAAIASSHQLTPFMLIAVLSALVFARQTGPAWLPWLMSVLSVGWIALMAQDFLRENISWIVASIGKPAANTQTTLIDLGSVPAGQQLVARADRILTAGMGVLAAVGWLRMWRAGRRESVPALLALAPIPLLAVNNYGGEMLFRVYLFALPGLALLAAGLVYPGSRANRARWWVVLPGVLSLAMAAAFCLAYDGKERMNYFTSNEIAGSVWLYDHAPVYSFIVAPTADFPWAFTHYDTYEYEFLDSLSGSDELAMQRAPVAALERDIAGYQHPNSFLIVSRSALVSAQYTARLPRQAVALLQSGLGSVPRFQVVYRNPDVVIYQFTPDHTERP